ncbi:T9SS type A sorting domain-containing protein [Hymenobacter sp. ASUV-10]|uniref:T9SS type A sorting domain-containing protein n=1 Tax=Hymenobacter aranciens TaxID=3063996 RepID=A0ABT9BBP9_9BACT|nr:T9SS type A sorting domain-containing protein [Hymenobacter sp. ASUV-10]MDO7875673.1 T9SS type A sorting domain-containing protein [Hymenobacter sp. ASUV-10]
MKNFTPALALLVASALTAGTAQAQTITTVGIIGTSTAQGWTASTPMNRVAGSTNSWTLTTPLTAGEAKFRANDAWDINWGSTTFPTGTGTQGGANIPVATADTYTILFNETTGDYQFSVVTATRAASAAMLKMSMFPNPGRDVVVSFELPAASTVAISVLNNLGQTVKTLAPMTKAAGSNAQALALGNLASGIYTVKLQAGEYVQTSRVVVE